MRFYFSLACYRLLLECHKLLKTQAHTYVRTIDQKQRHRDTNTHGTPNMVNFIVELGIQMTQNETKNDHNMR